MEEQILAKQAELLALFTEMEGMVAENKSREYLGQYIAYHEDAFIVKAEEMRAVANQIKQMEKQ